MVGASLAILVPGLPASAHDPKPRHGGAIAMAGTYHVELVVNDGQVDVYLVGHDDKPVVVTGRKGLAILMADGKSVRVPLAPVGAERLSGKAADASLTAPKGVVQITEPAGGTVQARFN
ncbi:MAG: hypothetical protein K2Z80_08645 [Xanthobacteraceae bacterium]|nr:hypothetical protein [Xanthobacteraceae bacterium]